MRCEKCGIDYDPQSERCPNCGASAIHGGKTEFYGKAAYSKVSIIDFFNGMFSKHPKGTAIKLFMSGTPDTTPRADQMLAQWQKPWLFFRLLVIGLIFTALCGVMIYLKQAAGYITLWTMGSLIIPLTILTFYWEINIPRDIPIYTVVGVFFIGGAISLVITLVMSEVISSEYGQFAWFAPVYEEPAKLLAAAIFIKKLNVKYGFGGILLGGAVGAGFAAFENIMYVINNYSEMNYWLGVADAVGVEIGDPTAAPMELFFMRSLLSFGGHTIWAAMYCGALVLEKCDSPLSVTHFFKKKFLIYFGAAFGLHFLWNLINLGIWVQVGLTAAGIFVLFTIIKTCLTQVVQTAEMARFNPNVPPVSFASGIQPVPPPQQMYQQQNMAPQQNFQPNMPSQPNYQQQNMAPQQNFQPNMPPQPNYQQQNMAPQQNIGQNMPPQQNFQQQNAALQQNLGQNTPQHNYQQQNIAPEIYQQQNIAPPQMSATVAVKLSAQLVGISGSLQGKTIDFTDEITVGRDPAQCKALFPANTPGISRKHCSVRLMGDSLMITDHGSSSGTFLANGQKVPQGQWVNLNGAFYLGNQQNMFSVNIK